MLTIRKAQMDLFATHFAKRFRRELRLHVRTEFPIHTQTMTDVDLDRQIGEGLVRGRTHGLTTERDLMLFVDLPFLLGPDFERDPKRIWVRRILLNQTLEGSAKMEAIYRRLAAFEDSAAAVSTPPAS
jgi:hypothetical protein